MTKAGILAASFFLALLPSGVLAKDTQFWNLTANTITSLELSPAARMSGGANQTDNDRDHTVDHDERLKITDTTAGTYDVKSPTRVAVPALFRAFRSRQERSSQSRRRI